ncbi:hypothetical protein PPD64_003805 [Providencia stuartii]|uniref:Lipoprotein n=2 Tax=Enterobacterales TaxID=91347 RepID=A0AA86YNM8_PROST|nr:MULTISPECIES: hypothetical protein [Morganellaceae]EDU61086.1 hypothetical protein PROSTU_01067 [Providencia stuartii ATCC 25827]MTB65633.1 hypothetical protein [Providencia sp. wls1943]MBI6378829.1 hypothetical protein [Proteus mirabilis]MBS3857555.1 hypothetical protein [Proteus mirabilis]MBS7783249.1 hypothetical protein [Providencia thailandensis]
MMKSKAAFVMLALLGLVGCSTNRWDASASKEVPMERMSWESDRYKNEGKSEVVIKRYAGYEGMGCSQQIYFNGMKLSERDCKRF